MQLTDTQMRTAITFFQSICNIMQQKGYTPSPSSSIDFKDANAHGAYSNSTIIYGPDENRSYLYLSGCFDFADPEHMAQCQAEKTNFAMNVKTLKELKLGKMLDMIQEVQQMAGDFDIPVDFINPLTLMADQLRTNILEYHAPIAERPLCVVAVDDEDHGTFVVNI